jgi:hypothetical protein
MKQLANEEKEMIINFGSLGYDANRCAGVLETEEAEITKLMADKNSEFSKLYARGQYRAEYVIDVKLFELAQTGDIKAIEKLEARAIKRNRAK